MERRSFLTKTLSVGAGCVIAPSIAKSVFAAPTPRKVKDDISLAQWALVDEFKSGKLKTLAVCRMMSILC